MKVIITSATLDIKKFADYFGAPMVKIPGKIFPVEIEYLPSRNRSDQSPRKNFKPIAPLYNRTKVCLQYMRESILLIANISITHPKL